MSARYRVARIVLVPDSLCAVLVLSGLVLIALILAAYALTFPQLTGRVVDEAGILDPAAKTALESKLAEFETKTTGQLVVVTLKSLQGTSIEDYGYQLGRHWGIGQKEKNSGALLIVVPSERKVRIEVGYGLEGQLTDAVSKLIIENAIVPRFRAGDFAGGINRGVDDIMQALADPDEWRQRAKQRPDSQPFGFDIVLAILLVIVVIMILRSVARSGVQDPRNAAGRRAGRGGPIFVPVPWGSGSGSSDWSDSSWSGSSGGFSGGGGSFGGGGASGSW
jgi:uncharacterized protein